jgi:hypothetical protein
MRPHDAHSILEDRGDGENVNEELKSLKGQLHDAQTTSKK